MSEIIPLTGLKRGDAAIITELVTHDDMRRRLQDIGLIEGTVVECLGKSPLGDPIAFLIRGAVIALRSEDSSQVLVKLKEQEQMEPRRKGEVVTAADIREERLWD